MKSFFNICVFVLGAFLFFNSCEKDDVTGPEGTVKSLTVTHWGVDWSLGKVASQNSSVDNFKHDGETVAWCAYGSMSTTYNGVWFRPNVDKLKKLNITDLNSAGTVDTTWSTDVCSTPCNNGDVWLAKCSDGYVIFKVKKQPDPNANDWPLEVDYIYSKTNKFN